MFDYDFIIIGSGFGGSVSAMRLCQKGYRVLLVEKGKHYNNSDYAKTNLELKKFIWAPIFKLFGIQQLTLLNKMLVLHGVGVGGGSLVYANTLMKPQIKVLQKKLWPTHFSQLQQENCYSIAEKMLGVTENKFISAAEPVMQKLAKDLNVEKSFHLTKVGVYFNNQAQKADDPYFLGDGPPRQPCTGCGSCMIGCPVGAKNTLDKNYLYFAKKWGCEILPEHEVTVIKPHTDGYELTLQQTTKYFSKTKKLTAHKVILSAGVIGTLKLLFANKYKHKTLPEISDKLGCNVRTNGESLCGASAINDSIDYSKGIAIGSAIHTDENTKIEPVRYPAGSDLMKLLAVPQTANGNLLIRPLMLIYTSLKRPRTLLKLITMRDWAKKTIILLVMQSTEEKMRFLYKRSFFNFFKRGLYCLDPQNSVKSFIPIAQKASLNVAQQINGIPQNIFSEVVLNTPATAHILGGCVSGDNSDEAVINQQQELFGYKNIYISDGSVIPVNLGVNPSLTITALTESFCEQFPLSSNITNDEFKRRFIKFNETESVDLK